MNQDTIYTAMDHLSALLNYTSPPQQPEASSGSLVFQTTLHLPFDYNRIVFGAPGTGKSHTIKTEADQLLSGGGMYERVTFHPDYTYFQFVGGYKPVSDKNGEVRYQFVPGPFTRVLTSALINARTSQPKPHLLIIEEINRAKMAAVFGDLFQLLDRDEFGVSEYEIHISEEMRQYLSEKLSLPPEELTQLKLPNNLFIWASMNSADQGVYPMDTAFKRRWEFTYLGIDTNQHLAKGIVTLGAGAHAKEIEWNQLRKAINEWLSLDFHLNEDKLLGPFFLSTRVLASGADGRIRNQSRFIETFKSKVLMYLYEDAAKQYRGRLFPGCDSTRYSRVCEAFDRLGIGIFGTEFETLYDRFGV